LIARFYLIPEDVLLKVRIEVDTIRIDLFAYDVIVQNVPGMEPIVRAIIKDILIVGRDRPRGPTSSAGIGCFISERIA